MSYEQASENPYAIPDSSKQPHFPLSQSGPQRVPIRVLDTISRAWNFIREQYWMLLVILLFGLFLGSLVPMNILLGAMMVGFYLCLMQVERGEKADFATLFKSFDQFLDSLLVIIAVTLLNIMLMIPLMLVAMGIMFASIAGNGNQEPGVGFFIIFASLYPLIITIGIITYLPFLFSFQLIADRKVGAVDAIKLSCKAVWMNLGGILLLLIVIVFISVVLTLMCIFPGILFMPVSTTCFWILYRDIFAEPVVEAEVMN